MTHSRASIAAAASIAVVAGLLASPIVAASTDAPVAAAVAAPGGGWEVTRSGAVTSFGTALLPAGPVDRPTGTVVGMAATADHAGYWLVTADGAVSAVGDARRHGSLAGRQLTSAVVGMAATVDGGGYWLVQADGAVSAFGDAARDGSLAGRRPASPVVGMAAPPGGGYWLVQADGVVSAFGGAVDHGSLPARDRATGVVGMASAAHGRGYWLAGADGSVYSFGAAGWHGRSTSGRVVAVVAHSAGGYWLVRRTGPTLPCPRLVTTTTTIAPPSTTAPPTTTPPTTAPPTTAPPTTTTTAPASTTTVTPRLGVLEADPTMLSADQAAGISLATLNLSWKDWEPEQGVVDTQYRGLVEEYADEYRAAGWEVAIDLGLQQPPSWALSLTGATLVNQYGYSPGVVDFEYSQAARTAAAAYITQVVQSAGAIQDYRIGLSENGESYYPDAGNNGWWAFSQQAQGKAAGLPAGVGVTPMPGWVPGTTTYDNQPVTATQVSNWYGWYFGAMVSAVSWEISTYRAAGYHGQLELVLPGMGALPAFYQERLGADLAAGSEDSFSTLNDGAVWWLLLDDLGSATLGNVAIDVSSVFDASGRAQGNGCTTADSSVAVTSDAIWGWSDTRWLAYLAQAHGLPVMGENPGNTPASDLPGIMNLVYSCHLTALQWAWDYTLQQGNETSRTQLQDAFAEDR